MQLEPMKAIVIMPITPKEDMISEQVKKTLLTEINPRQLGVRPEKIYKSGTHEVKIIAKHIDETAIDVEALKQVGLKYEVQGRLRPRMAVYEVPSDVGADVIKEEISNMVEGSFKNDFEVKFGQGTNILATGFWKRLQM